MNISDVGTFAHVHYLFGYVKEIWIVTFFYLADSYKLEEEQFAYIHTQYLHLWQVLYNIKGILI